MSIVILTIVFFVSVILGYFVFKRVINPISIYSFVWFYTLFAFELKYIRYYDLSSETWFFIGAAYLSMLMGIFISHEYFKRRLTSSDLKISETSVIFSDKGMRLILISAYILSFIALFAILHYWTVLIKMYGSIPKALLSLNDIYNKRLQGEIKGTIPYLQTLASPAIFLAAIYTAYKRRINLITPFVIIISFLWSTALAGRFSILYSLTIYVITYTFTVFYLSKNDNNIKKKNNFKFYFSLILLAAVVFWGMSFIKAMRGGKKSWEGETRAIKKLEKNDFVNSTFYLYASIHPGVYSAFLNQGGKDNERFGEHSFKIGYNVLSKFGLIEPSFDYMKFYRTPVKANTGSYLMALHSEFGVGGVFIVPFLLGLLVTIAWKKLFIQNNFKFMLFLVYLSVYLALSNFQAVTVLAEFYIGQFVLLIVIPSVTILCKRNAEKEALKKV